MSYGPALLTPRSAPVGLMLVAAPLAALTVATCGCAGYIHDSSAEATQAAIDRATSLANKQKIAGLGTAMGDAARAAMFNDDTTAKSRALAGAVDAQVRTDLLQTQDELAEKLAAEVATLTARLRESERQLIAEAAGPATQAEVGTLIDSAGPHLNALIDGAAPHIAGAVQSSIAPIQVTVDAEAGKWKSVAIWAAAAAIGLLIAIGVCLHVISAHRKMLAALAGRL